MLSIIVNAQQTGFTLDEIKQVMPDDLSQWQHDDLIAALRKKIADIESMEVKLAQSKAHLMSLIQLIGAKPEGMDCEDNAQRVLGTLGLSTGKKTSPWARGARSCGVVPHGGIGRLTFKPG